MKFFKILTIYLVFILFFQFKNTNIVLSKNLVSTDYIHDLNQNIENIVDDDLSTYFVLPDFINYLEFKVEPMQATIISIKYTLVMMDMSIMMLILRFYLEMMILK